MYGSTKEPQPQSVSGSSTLSRLPSKQPRSSYHDIRTRKRRKERIPTPSSSNMSLIMSLLDSSESKQY
ncbi:unnamed protein product [Cochlearia groenlandica]